ncbi:HAMP domain-containing protein [bacterium]|nr:HAMP domain-containing protein [bacterium]
MVNWFFKLKLSKKIIAIFSIVIVPLVISNIWIILTQKDQSTSQLQNILQKRYLIVKNRIDDIISYQDLDIYTYLIDESKILRLCSENKNGEAYLLMKKYLIDRGYYSIKICDSKGVPIIENYLEENDNLNLSGIYRELTESGKKNSRDRRIIFAQTGIILITETPIQFRNKLYIAMATRITSWKEIKQLSSILNIEITIFNNNDTVFTTLFNEDSTRLMSRKIPENIYQNLQFSEHFFFANENILWGEYCSLFRLLFSSGNSKNKQKGIISISINTDYIDNNIWFLRKIVYGSSLIVLLLIIIAAFFISRTITRPISKMIECIDEVMLGDYDVEIVIPNKDEIGYLGRKLNQMVIQLNERDKMKQYISKSLLREIQMVAVVGGGYADLGVKRSVKSVLFTDIRNFTKISEQLSPDELISILTLFYSNVTECVENQNGTVDKFIGDSVMAVFHEEENENTALRAVLSAIELKGRISQIRSATLINHDITLDIGIGIATGYVVEGSIGTKTFKDYTIVGDAVNVASRLENLSKNGIHSGIYIDEDSYVKVKDVIFGHEHEQIKIKGKDQPVNIYEVVCLKNRDELRSSFMSDELVDVESAINAVGISGNIEYLDRLLSFLKHKVPKIRIAAISSIVYLFNRFKKYDRDKKTREKICLFFVGALFREVDSFAKSKLIKTLGFLGGIDAIKSLTYFLHDPDARVRANVIEMFSIVENGDFIKQHLFPLLDDENHRVKGNAAQILWKKGFQKRTMEKLIEMSDSENWRSAASAVYSIGEIWDSKNYSQLVRMYLRGAVQVNIDAHEFFKINQIVVEALTNENLNVVKQAIIALGKIGDRNCVIPILRVINDDNYNELKPFFFKTFDSVGVSVEDMELIKMKFESYRI